MVQPSKIGHTAKEIKDMRHLVHIGHSVPMVQSVQMKQAARNGLKKMIAVGLMISGLAACSTPANTTQPSSSVPVINGPTPTNNVQPPPTIVPASGPTVAASSQVALSFLNALPAQLGRFTLAKNPDDPTKPKKNYVGTDAKTGIVVGAVATYELNGKSLVIALWLAANTNFALDRYSQEVSHTKVSVYPAEVGDEAIVAPTNKAVDNFIGIFPPLLGILRYRNIVIDIYPTKDLTDAYSDFTQSELTQVLQAMFTALPK
jgi:hypothetical protein